MWCLFLMCGRVGGCGVGAVGRRPRSEAPALLILATLSQNQFAGTFVPILGNIVGAIVGGVFNPTCWQAVGGAGGAVQAVGTALAQTAAAISAPASCPSGQKSAASTTDCINSCNSISMECSYNWWAGRRAAALLMPMAPALLRRSSTSRNHKHPSPLQVL